MKEGIVDRILKKRLSSFAYERWTDLREEVIAMGVHRRGVHAAQYIKWPADVRLNIGCGPVKTPGYMRIDYCPRVDLRVDLRRPLPIPDDIASELLCEHFLEHLRYPGNAGSFLKECHRILKLGGELYISVPDTRWPMECYVHGRDEWEKACEENNWHPEWVKTTMEHVNYHFRQQDEIYGDGHFECHRFAYDEETLALALRRAGFSKVEPRVFDPKRDSEHRRVGSLFMLAIK
jgi:SAM-dependent methyltransferase